MEDQSQIAVDFGLFEGLGGFDSLPSGSNFNQNPFRICPLLFIKIDNSLGAVDSFRLVEGQLGVHFGGYEPRDPLENLDPERDRDVIKHKIDEMFSFILGKIIPDDGSLVLLLLALAEKVIKVLDCELDGLGDNGLELRFF